LLIFLIPSFIIKKIMKKNYLLLAFFLLFSGITKSQCLPDNCGLLFTNMIDCDVILDVAYTCPPSAIVHHKSVTLSAGNSSTPFTLTLGSIWLSPPEACDCDDIAIQSVSVVSIGSYAFVPPVALGSSTTNLYPTTCCNVDYGTYSGCSVTLWMSCP